MMMITGWRDRMDLVEVPLERSRRRMRRVQMWVRIKQWRIMMMRAISVCRMMRKMKRKT